MYVDESDPSGAKTDNADALAAAIRMSQPPASKNDVTWPEFQPVLCTAQCALNSDQFTDNTFSMEVDDLNVRALCK